MSVASARLLRWDMTDAERRLSSVPRRRQLAALKFRRQHPIGPFVMDFARLEYRLVIEGDGGQHAQNEADVRRTEWLRRDGWRVMRFWNHEILTNPIGVQEAILVAAGRFF